jgi:hypothetical protein
METCTVETGLLKKKPCGKAAVTHCVNCEQALCAQHAVPEVAETGKKTGKFLCKECHVARREYQKTMGSMQSAPPPPAAKKPDEPAKGAPPKEAPAAKETPAENKPAEKKDDGGIDFTPSKK